MNGENGDKYPNDPTQWADSDSDGKGDNVNGTNGDAARTKTGSPLMIGKVVLMVMEMGGQLQMQTGHTISINAKPSRSIVQINFQMIALNGQTEMVMDMETMEMVTMVMPVQLHMETVPLLFCVILPLMELLLGPLHQHLAV